MRREYEYRFICVDCGNQISTHDEFQTRCRDCKIKAVNGRISLPVSWSYQQYRDYLESYRWYSLAQDAKQRAHHRCQLCYSPNKLQAHHRTYERLGHEWSSDITVLCERCHKAFSKYMKKFRRATLD